MSYIFTYFMNYLKSLTITQNYLSYFKDNIFNIFSQNIRHKKYKNKQLNNTRKIRVVKVKMRRLDQSLFRTNTTKRL